MEPRSPDAYKTERLFSEVTHDEIELAILASLDEEYRQLEKCSSQWDSFQVTLSRLKRIGNYDKDVFRVYEMLSIYLYKYTYAIYETLSEESYQFIKTHLKGIRFSETEQESLTKALNRLRYGP